MIWVDGLLEITVLRIFQRSELVFAKWAVGESVGGALAADPLIDACAMEPVLAVIDLSQHLCSLEVLEADTARIGRGASARCL